MAGALARCGSSRIPYAVVVEVDLGPSQTECAAADRPARRNSGQRVRRGLDLDHLERLWAALLGEPPRARGQCATCRGPTSMARPRCVRETVEKEERFEAVTVANLKSTTARCLADGDMLSMVAELRAASTRICGPHMPMAATRPTPRRSTTPTLGQSHWTALCSRTPAPLVRPRRNRPREASRDTRHSWC